MPKKNKKKKKKMQKKIKDVLLLFIICFISDFYLCQQTAGHKIDSSTLSISYDENQHVIRACFTNQKNSVVILPWQEQLPYIEFEEDTVWFSIYFANNNEVVALGLQECVPDFTFESNNIELKPKGTSCKVIELEGMISRGDLINDNVLFAIYTFLKRENTEFKKYFLMSNYLTFETN